MQRSELTPEQRAWVDRLEPLWQRAYRIAQKHPDLDVSDIFHVLRNLQRSPSERLKRSLAYARHRAHRR